MIRRAPASSAWSISSPVPVVDASSAVVVLGAADDRQPAGAGHLDHGGALRQPPLRLERIAERAGDDRCAVRAAERFEDPVTAIGHRHLDAVDAQLPTGLADGARHLGAVAVPLNLSGAATTLRMRTSADASARRIPTCRVGIRAGSVAAMSVTVRIPTTMRPLTGGEKQVSVETGTLSDVIAALEAAHPGLGERLVDDDGGLRKFVNIFVDDDDVRYLDGLDTKVADGITVSIIPAVAGG